MKSSLKFTSRTLLLLLLAVSPMIALAQNEVDRERSSLRGIQSMGFSVNYEANAPLADKEEIDVSSLRKIGYQALQEDGINVIPDEEVRESDQIPLLYLHINAMDVGRGLVPFAVNLYFYQPVKLTLNQDLQTTASTWESGMVGIASYDQLQMINEATEGLLREFLQDYNSINK